MQHTHSGYNNIMAFIITAIVLWVVFIQLVPFKEWRKYYPTILFTALIGTISDLIGVALQQWIYYGPVVGELSLWSVIGIAPAEGGLFLRLYPKRSKILGPIIYLCGWILVNTFFEKLFVWAGWIGYRHWNPFRAGVFYLLFFSLIWAQEYWYNGTGRINRKHLQGDRNG